MRLAENDPGGRIIAIAKAKLAAVAMAVQL
jgi:hypothetical protein